MTVIPVFINFPESSGKTRMEQKIYWLFLRNDVDDDITFGYTSFFLTENRQGSNKCKNGLHFFSAKFCQLESILPIFFLIKRIVFPFFAIKIGHFRVQTIFFYATNTQA
jgi:hypothetical protein